MGIEKEPEQKPKQRKLQFLCLGHSESGKTDFIKSINPNFRDDSMNRLGLDHITYEFTS